MRVKSPHAASPRFPAPRSSAQGESAPKARSKGVADGKQVNIPVPRRDAMWGRRKLCSPGAGCPRSRRQAAPVGKAAGLSRDATTTALRGGKLQILCFQEKPLSFSHGETVPKTDTGGRDEYSQALERTREKELGKLTP